MRLFVNITGRRTELNLRISPPKYGGDFYSQVIREEEISLTRTDLLNDCGLTMDLKEEKTIEGYKRPNGKRENPRKKNR